jgi:hypothetical protein
MVPRSAREVLKGLKELFIEDELNVLHEKTCQRYLCVSTFAANFEF